MKFKVYISNTVKIWDERDLRAQIPQNPSLELCIHFKEANAVILHSSSDFSERFPQDIPRICLGCKCETKDFVIYARTVPETLEILNLMALAVFRERQLAQEEISPK